MDALLARWGIDPIQWRALVRALFRIDFPFAAKSQTAEEKRQSRGVLVVLVFFMLYGITPLLIVLAANDVLLGATVSVSLSAFAVAMTLTTGEAAEILSSNDLQILGHRPVSSRTYMGVRVAMLVLRSILVAAATSILPTAAFVMRYGIPGIRYAIALAVAVQLAGVAATFALVSLYGALIQRVGPERIQKYVAYAQAGIGFVVWGGFIVVTQDLVKGFVAGATMNPAVWLLFPPTWFAAIVQAAGGHATAWTVIGVVLALGTPGWLGWFIRDKLSMTYAESLTRTAAAVDEPLTKGSVARWMPAVRNEARAVLLLARAQMVYDMKFRMALISLLPMTVMYMFLNGWPKDPFLQTRGGGAPMIQMIVMFLPLMVRQVIVQSEAHKAGWIYHVTPARRSTLLSASRNVTTAFFLLPYLAVVAAFFSFAFGSATHALVHAAFMGLLSGMILQFDIMLRPQLPFSIPLAKDTRFGSQLITMLVGTLAGTAFYFVLTRVAYRSAGRMLIAAASCIALIAIMEWTTRRRINRRRVEDLYFD